MESFLNLKSLVEWNSKRNLAKCNIFQIPNEIIFTSINSLNIDSSSEDESNIVNSQTQSADSQYKLLNSGKTCCTCSLTFESMQLQREHFKSLLHQINLKRKLNNQKCITVEDIPAHVSDDTSENYNSGTDESQVKVLMQDVSDIYLDSDNEDDESNSKILVADDENLGLNYSSNELNKVVVSEEFGNCIPSYSSQNGHLLTYHNSKISNNYELIFNTSILAKHHLEPFWHESSLKANINKNWYFLKYLSTLSKDRNQLWAVFILSSGRFAGTIFDCSKSNNNPIVINKVFRRYTVRAKAGGSQSSHDSGNGKAKSMGAILRRYGEAELTKDIQELLLQWSGYIQTCSKVLLSVPKTMRHILFGFNSSAMVASPLQRDDNRICYIPFIVSKPTLEETKSVFYKCTTVLFKRRSEFSTNTHPSASESVISAIKETDNSSVSQTEAFIETTENDEDFYGFIDDLKFAHDYLHTGDVDNIKSTHVSITSKQKIKSSIDAIDFVLPECKYSKLLIQACYDKNVRHVQIILNFLKMQCNCDQSKLLLDYSNELDEDDGDNVEEETEIIVSNVDEKHLHTSEITTESQLMSSDKQLFHILEEELNHYSYDWDLDTVVNLPENIQDLQTPLHIASQLGQPQIVKLLLLHGADPTKFDSRNRTPYFLCFDKHTRDMYRKMRGASSKAAENINNSDANTDILISNEIKWDWDKAGVGESMTFEKLLLKREKEKEKKKKSKQKKKNEKLKIENEMKEKLQLLELEEKKNEEEKKKIISLLCDSCGKPFTYGMKPLEFNNKKCCSNNCVVSLRRLLAAEAAMNRLGSKRMVM